MSRVTATWTTDRQFVAESGTGHAIVLDTPAEVGGRNTGPTPMELLLMGLAGCTGIDVVFILGERMKKTVTGVQVEVSGARADQPPKVYTRIEVFYRIRGQGIAQKDAVRAMRLSAEKFCSASVMLGKTAEMSWSYELTDEETGQTCTGAL